MVWMAHMFSNIIIIIIITLKELYNLVMVLPNYRIFHASSNSLGVELMHCVSKIISGL